MITESEAQFVASVLLRKFGDDALEYAANRSREHLDNGDSIGGIAWEKIMLEVAQTEI